MYVCIPLSLNPLPLNLNPTQAPRLSQSSGNATPIAEETLELPNPGTPPVTEPATTPKKGKPKKEKGTPRDRQRPKEVPYYYMLHISKYL